MPGAIKRAGFHFQIDACICLLLVWREGVGLGYEREVGAALDEEDVDSLDVCVDKEHLPRRAASLSFHVSRTVV